MLKMITLTLKRNKFRSDGIFSTLTDMHQYKLAETLEHAYLDASGQYLPKIPGGAFKCVRGKHRLHGMTSDFETFEITGVRGHVNLLFHWGNYNADSEGCVLLGKNTIETIHKNLMVTESKSTFKAFMDKLQGIDEFTLVII